MQKQLKNDHIVLGIETSCDDTSIALVTATGQVLCNLIVNQNKAHQPFAGIVPEIAGRKHLEVLLPLLDEGLKKTGVNWEQINGIAVTQGPGLMGSLLVGTLTAEMLALTKAKSLIGIHHLEGHILAPFLKDDQYKPLFEYTQPFLALTVSGGHTAIYHVKAPFQYELLENTVDDAAGEAFDKLAQMLGLGFPGGVQIDHLAKTGDPAAFSFPRPLLKRKNFSFSGLKTAALQVIKQLTPSEIKAQKSSICASYQEAIVDVLMSKLITTSQTLQIKNVVITGGVSGNSRLRQRATTWASQKNITLAIPPLSYCMDNAAMIGFAGLLRLQAGYRSQSPLIPQPVFPL